ncbi:GIY-YIG nuclease family protein [Cryomorpha ignava]|uniref:GIY-YIG nuclease family protein n=1 Tax=Cryomorpha ignava TaxID=101383 RepID=A0A7K3WMA0_9FLAO|nr:GIY-YIG nuclease family protein [Cryomorpha ignava]NEN22141.1 GIY-YIG nuclease family protein [Cryomorpha ignava]
MEYYVYILYSKSIDRYYVGKSENPNKRFLYHNSEHNKIWTKRGKPWTLEKIISFENSTQASKVELFIKKQKSIKFIQKIIKDGWNDLFSKNQN